MQKLNKGNLWPKDIFFIDSILNNRQMKFFF